MWGDKTRVDKVMIHDTTRDAFPIQWKFSKTFLPTRYTVMI